LSFSLHLDPAHPYLRERGLSDEDIETFGLGLASRGVMAGRIAIPIHDELGQLVAYAGRWPGPLSAAIQAKSCVKSRSAASEYSTCGSVIRTIGRPA
jgi:hypothetical protein